MEALTAETFLEHAGRFDQLFLRAHIDNRQSIRVRLDIRVEIWLAPRVVDSELFGVIYAANLRDRISRDVLSHYSSPEPTKMAAETLDRWNAFYPRWVQPQQELVTYIDDGCFDELSPTSWLLFGHLMQLRAAIDYGLLGLSITRGDAHSIKELARRMSGLIDDLYKRRFALVRTAE